VNPLAPSFDTVGVLARNEEILAKAASVLLACDISDSSEVGAIHLLTDVFAICETEIQQAIAKPVNSLKSLFPGKIREISLQEIDAEPTERGLKGWYETYCLVQWAEIWSCLGAWVKENNPEFGPRIKRNFDLVKDLDRTTVLKSTQQRERYYRSLRSFLGANDLICIPTAPFPAPIKGSLGVDRTVGDYYPRTLGVTAIAGIGRLPQVSMPVAEVDGAPVGLSLLAAQGKDAFLLSAVRSIFSKIKSD
jgi:amidase